MQQKIKLLNEKIDWLKGISRGLDGRMVLQSFFSLRPSEDFSFNIDCEIEASKIVAFYISHLEKLKAEAEVSGGGERRGSDQ